MGNSSLVDVVGLSPNKTSPRNGKITKLTPHHTAGVMSVESLIATFAKPSRQASCNYGIGSDARVALIVPESDRSWCSSSGANDNIAVTFEVSNSVYGGNWPVSDPVFNKLVAVCTDVCKRNGIKSLVYTGDATGNLTAHKFFAATACPGPYLLAKFPELAARVNANLGASTEITNVAKVEVTGGNPYAKPTSLVKSGDNSRQVLWVQWELIRIGYKVPFTYKGKVYSCVTLDAAFGESTHAAVSHFQESMNITVDGIVGPQTIEFLKNAVSDSYKGTTLPTIGDKLYRVQVGAYKNRSNAENQLKLVTKALPSLKPLIVESGDLYKVQIGAYKNKDNAMTMFNELKSKGFSPYLSTENILQSTSQTVTAQAMEGNEAVIWKYLMSKINNPYGVAGLMGNLFAESGLSPINLQNSYEKLLGYTDKSYTAAVDNGTYKNFVKDAAGYGLAQWTYYTRKQKLLDYAKSVKKSVGDINVQLEYLWTELQGYKGVLSTLKTAKTVKAASDVVLTEFERPADQSAQVKAKRAEYGEIFYNKYK